MSGSSTTMMIATNNQTNILTTRRYKPFMWYWMARRMPKMFGNAYEEKLRPDTSEGKKWVIRVLELRIGQM